MSGGAPVAPAGPVLPGVERVLVEARAAGAFPAWDAVVARPGHVLHHSRGGDSGPWFDVASVTKPVSTGTLAAILVAEGRLRLDAPAAEAWPAFGQAGKERVTVRHLLAHSAGLPVWRPYFEAAIRDPVAGKAFLPPDRRPLDLSDAFSRGRELVESALCRERLEVEPGTRALYGDPAFQALGVVVARAGGDRLDRLFSRHVADPLGLGDTFFVGAERVAAGTGPCAVSRFAPTERCLHRHEVNRGTVNDDNAWAVGGIAGHAGIFSTAADVARLGVEWLEALHGRGSILDRDVAREFARSDATPGSVRSLGWDGRSAGESCLGGHLGWGPLGAIGHLGYTGCSLWIDRDRELVCALLTNHVHPNGRKPGRILAARQAFHDAVAEAVG